MRWLGLVNRWMILLALLGATLGGLSGCGCNTPGRMEWVQPFTTDKPRVGIVYCIRGWKGVFSPGIDAMAKKLNAQGVTAYAYMPEQYPEMAATMIQRYKNSPNHEPICFIGHSRGVDSSIIIAHELEKAGVSVQLIVCLDSVDETTITKNVQVCYNFWTPGFFYGTNLFRGIPLKQEPGSTGKLYNFNLHQKEGEPWSDAGITHVGMDSDRKLQQNIIKLVLESCPERAKWVPQVGAQSVAAPTRTDSSSR